MESKNSFAKDTLGWGFVLWLIGWVLGIILFMLVPPAMIGWFITPVGIAVTLWVLLKKIKPDGLAYYFALGIIWTVIAIVLDYLLIVKLFQPEDGYYKLDVYLYYTFTFALPVLVGLWKRSRN